MQIWLEVDFDGQLPDVRALPEGVSHLIFRAAQARPSQLASLVSVFKGEVIYEASGLEDSRWALGLGALIWLDAASPDFVAMLSVVPPERRILFQRRLASDLGEVSQVAARHILVEVEGEGAELASLSLMQRSGGPSLLTWAAGDGGVWTRLLAPHFGAVAVMGAWRAQPERGLLGLDQLTRDYGLPEWRPIEGIYGILGNPIFDALSPRIHNTAYRALGLPYFYVPFQQTDFATFQAVFLTDDGLGKLGLPLLGLTIVSPFKKAVVEAISEASHPVVRQAKTCNMLLRGARGWCCDSSDPSGILESLQSGRIEGLRAAVLGCGGSGRAVAATLKAAGVQVTLFNRTEARGRRASALLKLPFEPLEALDPGNFWLIVNATPVGSQGEGALFDPARMAAGSTVIDYAYGAQATELVVQARAASLRVVDGREVLATQVRRQFAAMTGQEMPLELARRHSALSENAR